MIFLNQQGGSGKAVALADFDGTISGLCASILHARCAVRPEELETQHSELVRYVVARHAGMPDFMRVAFRITTLAFDLMGILHAGSRFHCGTHASRRRQIEAWRGSRASLLRDFIRFHESLVVYGWYSSHGR